MLVRYNYTILKWIIIFHRNSKAFLSKFHNTNFAIRANQIVIQSMAIAARTVGIKVNIHGHIKYATE